MPAISYQGQYVKIGPNLTTVPFFLQASRSFVSAPSEGGTYDTSIYTHAENSWAVTDSCTWISITNGSGSGDGTFSIVVDERATGSEGTLSGRVTISSRAVDVYIDVMQVPIPDSILLTPDSSTIGAGGLATEAVCVVDSFIAGQARDWTAAVTTGSAYISVDSATGSSGGSLLLSIDLNGTNPRQGTIDVSCGTAQATFSICQDGTSILCSDL